MSEDRTDVLIAGGGSAGMALAVALKSGAPGMAVEVVDPRGPQQPSGDLRASAIAAGARRMLGVLGVWQELEEEAQPILGMRVTDGRGSDAVRPTLLNFGGPAEDGEPFAHMVPNETLSSALRRRADELGVTVTRGGVEHYATSEETIEARLGFGATGTRRASLLVAADGVRSRLRALAGIRTTGWSYPQSAIVGTIGHSRGHGGIAVEHFMPEGPLALLPLKGERSSIVWTVRARDAQRILGDQEAARGELARLLGRRYGDIELLSPLGAYPLSLLLVRRFVADRLALLGDAAHGIHPIAGQGLNLGFKDAAALAEEVVGAHRLGLDIGGEGVLEAYQRARRFDTWQMGAATDVLNRLFSNDNPLLRMARDAGLRMVEGLPRMKDYFVAEAAGESGAPPKLMSGQPL